MLTKKQYELFKYIDSYLKENGVSPSFEEMKNAVGLKSKSGIHRLVASLQERGFISHLANRARALEVKKYPTNYNNHGTDNNVTNITPIANDDLMNIPLYGKIAAGTPIAAIKDTGEETVPVAANMLGKGNFYALKVEGQSMIEAGINDGDRIIIQEAQKARDGEIVVALVDNEEVTLKYFKQQNDKIALIPANPDYDTRILDAGRVQIQGKLALLVRNYN